MSFGSALGVEPGPLHDYVRRPSGGTVIERSARPRRDHEVRGRESPLASFQARRIETRPSSSSISRFARSVFGSPWSSDPPFELATNVKHAAVEIHVAPDEAERLREPQAREGEQGNERPTLTLGSLDEAPEILGAKLAVLLRRPPSGAPGAEAREPGCRCRRPSSSAHEQNSESAVRVPRIVQGARPSRCNERIRRSTSGRSSWPTLTRPSRGTIRAKPSPWCAFSASAAGRTLTRGWPTFSQPRRPPGTTPHGGPPSAASHRYSRLLLRPGPSTTRAAHFARRTRRVVRRWRIGSGSGSNASSSF